MKPSQLSATLRHIAAKIDNSKRPDRTLVARELKRVVAAVSGEYGNTKEVEEALYGKSGAETDPDMQGSSIWWLVFGEIDLQDWTPLTNYSAVEKKALELLNDWSNGWNIKNKQERINREMSQLKNNWTEYQKNYMPEHIEILKEKNLMK